MAMNPMQLMKIKGMLDGFQKRHPRVMPFFRDAANRIQEGSVIEVKITGADGHSITSNIRVTAEDMEMLREARDFTGSMQ